MKIHAFLITSGLLVAITGAAKADDHLSNALDHGLGGPASGTAQSTTKSDAPGQGSPFSGNDTGTPSNDIGATPKGEGPHGNASSAPGHTSDHTAH